MPRYWIIAIALMAASHHVSSAQPELTRAQKQAILVTQMYLLTYGNRHFCERIMPQDMASIDSALLRFRKAFPDLMDEIDRSPHLEMAKRTEKLLIDGFGKSVANEELAKTCQNLPQTLDDALSTLPGQQMAIELKK